MRRETDSFLDASSKFPSFPHMESRLENEADNQESRVGHGERKRRTLGYTEPLDPATTEATSISDFLVKFWLIFLL